MAVVKAAAHGMSSGGLGLMARFLLLACGRGVIVSDVKPMGPTVVVVLETTNSAANGFGGFSGRGSGDRRSRSGVWGDRGDAIEGELGL
jgi:hypothetical protein